ncbi:EI24 domain-containing protein [Streptoalloteichus hindustanus]|nr:EI24 domain-containing protein [Streptoalloteichus hindustanus]
MREFVAGVRLFGRGFGTILRSPRLLLLGAVPALITTVLLLGAWIMLGVWLSDIATWLTPFADGWSDLARTATRVAAGIAVLGAAVAVGVVSFTALTLLIGDPFYEKISEIVDQGLGGAPDAGNSGWLRGLLQVAREVLSTVVLSVLWAIPLFLAGFIPVLGQTVVPVIAAFVGAWLLVRELVAVPFGRREIEPEQRRLLLRQRRGLAFGVGMPAYLLSIIPFAAIVVMPAAVVAATLLGRELLGQPTGVRLR